jgi:hypothetical protein
LRAALEPIKTNKMPVMKFLTALLLMLPLTVHADWDKFDVEFEADKPWVELAAQLPPYPQTENLLEFNVSSATRNRHYVDAASISVGSDKVVRYTVVIESAGGARNVSFEGMRCATGNAVCMPMADPTAVGRKPATLAGRTSSSARCCPITRRFTRIISVRTASMSATPRWRCAI